MSEKKRRELNEVLNRLPIHRKDLPRLLNSIREGNSEVIGLLEICNATALISKEGTRFLSEECVKAA
jgi:hypothetical protein